MLRNGLDPDPKHWIVRYLDGQSFWFPLLLFGGELGQAADTHHQLAALELQAEVNRKYWKNSKK